MGKALLLLVLSASVGGSTLLAQMHTASTERAKRESSDSYEQIAQDLASSGYAMGSQQLQRSYAPFSQQGVSYGEGAYDLQAAPGSDGRLVLRAVGHVGGMRYSVAGEYARMAAPCDLLGAVFMNAQPGASAFQIVGSGIQVRGEDTRPPSGGGSTGAGVALDGPGYNVAGILADSVALPTFSVPLAGVGTLSAGVSIGATGDDGYLRRLVGCLMSLAADAAATPDEYAPGNRLFNDRSFGAPAAPVTVVVEGDAEFMGETRGYGVLLVGGNFIAGDDFEWEGLVMAMGDGVAAVHLGDEARIYGGLVGGGLSGATLLGTPLSSALMTLTGTLDAGGGIVGALGLFRRPMLFTLADDAAVFHSEEALGRVHVMLPGHSDARTVLLNERFGIAAAQ